ncbi:hypothetical protein CPC08DRAFT_709479 [Agrocybe pediades]|nr:hypothetical protein CPC08DRAFT_709479 [Agrocybe pediades]
MKNTQLDDPSHNRLATARCSSQVCRQWRSVLLQASSIWGRLLDLDELRKMPYFWRDMLAERIADALLWIRGPVSVEMRPYFARVLDEKWDRIQVMDISDYEYSYDGEREKVYAPLLRKASNLQILKISIAEEDLRDGSKRWFSLQGRLFDNHAPFLDEIVFHGISYKFQPNAPWLSNLRVLSLDRQRSTLAVFRLLNAMPLLEHVRIADLFDMMILEDEGVELPSIKLPRLASLWLNSPYLFNLLPFLERLTPSKDCGLYIGQSPAGHGSFLSLQVELYVYTRMLEGIKRYMDGYFKHHPPTSLSISVGASVGITIQDYWDSQESPALFPSACFSAILPVNANTNGLYQPGEWLALPWLPKVEKLEFLMPQAQRLLHGFPLIPLLSTLSSVTTLSTSEEGLLFIMGHLNALQPTLTFGSISSFSLVGNMIAAQAAAASANASKPTFFPHLRTLKLTQLRKQGYPTTSTDEIFPIFLLYCIDSAIPLSVIDLTPISSQSLPGVGFLSHPRLRHLTIKWRMDVPGREPIIREDRCDSDALNGFQLRDIWRAHLLNMGFGKTPPERVYRHVIPPMMYDDD